MHHFIATQRVYVVCRPQDIITTTIATMSVIAIIRSILTAVTEDEQNTFSISQTMKPFYFAASFSTKRWPDETLLYFPIKKMIMEINTERKSEIRAHTIQLVRIWIQ